MNTSIKLNSSNIQVFPTTKRSGIDKRSKLLSEANLTNIVNMLLDKKAFVITNINSIEIQDNSNNIILESDSILEFNILGYYFKIDSIQALLDKIFDSYTDLVNSVTNNKVSIYANIDTVQIGDYEELYGTDNLNVYDGVSFSTNIETNKYLKILEIELDSNGHYKLIIPKESQVKLISRSIDNIDLGEI